MKRKQTMTGVVLTLLGGCFWGLCGACAQYLFRTEHVTSNFLVPWRMTLAGALLLGGLFAAGYVTGATAQAPALPDLLVTLGSSVLVLVACVFVETCPDEYAYDDVALAGDEG